MSPRNFDAELDSLRKPITIRDGHDGHDGRGFDSACEQAEMVEAARLPGMRSQRPPAEWSPTEAFAHRLAKLGRRVHQIEQRSFRAAALMGAAYQPSNTEPWALTEGSRRCLTMATSHLRHAEAMIGPLIRALEGALGDLGRMQGGK